MGLARHNTCICNVGTYVDRHFVICTTLAYSVPVLEPVSHNDGYFQLFILFEQMMAYELLQRWGIDGLQSHTEK